jgi:hypothetical protein
MMRFVSLLLLLLALSAGAEPLIVDLQGGDGHVSLIRDGARISPAPFLTLQPGDEIVVTAADAAVSIDLGGKVIEVDRRASPYRVPEPDRATVLDNALGTLITAYRSLVGTADQVVSIHSRGDPTQAPSLLCLAAQENLVPEGVPLLGF